MRRERSVFEDTESSFGKQPCTETTDEPGRVHAFRWCPPVLVYRKISYREITGTLEFHPAFGIDPIKIPDEVLGQRRIWREIGELTRRSKQPIHLADVCEMIESPDPSHACYHMRRAQEAGLVKKVGHQGCWIAID